MNDQSQPTKGELIESRLDKTAAGAMVLSEKAGGVQFQNMLEIMEFSKLMSLSREAVPKHLRDNPGMCLAVAVQAAEWRMSPFAVANKSYVVNDRIAWEAQLIIAVIEQRAPLAGRIRHSYDGEGAMRTCTVTAQVKGEVEPLTLTSPPIGQIKPKNSPLWLTKPDIQLFFNTARDFARVYFPDVILGVFSKDELEDSTIGADNAIDVTASPAAGLHERLAASAKSAAEPEGFRDGVVEAGLNGTHDGPEKAADASPQKRKPGRPRKETPATETAKADGLEEVLPKDEGGSGGGGSGDKIAVIEDGEVKGITDLRSQTTSVLPKDVIQYRAWVLEWLQNFDVPGDILGRWDAELKLRRACGVEQEERLSIRAIVDQRIKELTK